MSRSLQRSSPIACSLRAENPHHRSIRSGAAGTDHRDARRYDHEVSKCTTPVDASTRLVEASTGRVHLLDFMRAPFCR
jgi:hypothetical protein